MLVTKCESNMADLTVVQDKDGEYTGPRHALVHGVRIPFYEPNIDKDFEKDLSRFVTRAEDVYVVSYPKSGKFLLSCCVTLSTGY